MTTGRNPATAAEGVTLDRRLRHADPGTRLAALGECLTVEELPQGMAEVLAERLEDPEEGVRILAIEALWRCAGEGVPSLVATLEEGRQPASVRAAAASALARMHPPPVEAAAALAACVPSADAVLRWHAGYALGKLGRAAVPFLLPLLSSTDAGVVLTVLKVLENLGEEAFEALEPLSALENAPVPPHVALASAAARSRIRGEPAPLLLMLGKLLAGEDPSLREASLHHLADWGEAAKSLQEAVAGTLEDPHPSVRAAAAVTLARIEADPARAVPPLIRRLEDADAQVRRAAVMALAHLGPHAAEARDKLGEMERSEEGPLQSMVRAARRRIDPEHALSGRP